MGGGRLAPQKVFFFKLKDCVFCPPSGFTFLASISSEERGDRVEFGVSVQYEVTWGYGQDGHLQERGKVVRL